MAVISALVLILVFSAIAAYLIDVGVRGKKGKYQGEYRLTPAVGGGYWLEVWEKEFDEYSPRRVVWSKEEAEKIIEHLSKSPVYYNEG